MMWRPNRTTVFKDGSNISDICFQKQVFISREKTFQYKLYEYVVVGKIYLL